VSAHEYLIDRRYCPRLRFHRAYRVRNIGDSTAISLHIYGTDLGRIGSSARRYYDLPVRPAGPSK